MSEEDESKETGLQDSMAGRQEGSFTELLRPTLQQEDLRHTVEKLHSNQLTVPGLLLLSDSELDSTIREVFLEASVGVKVGIKSAIRIRKDNRLHGSHSGRLYGLNEKVMKQLAEFLDEAKESKSKKSFAISSVNSSEWDTLGRASGLRLFWDDLQYKPKRMSDLPPFVWDDRLEKSQADRYMPHLNKIQKAQKLMMINAANDYPTLSSYVIGGYTIRGTTDVAIIHRRGQIHPACALQCIFELRNKNVRQGRHQILIGLVMANILVPGTRPFAVLTDLIDEWTLYWMDGSISIFPALNQELLLLALWNIDHLRGLPFLTTVILYLQNILSNRGMDFVLWFEYLFFQL